MPAPAREPSEDAAERQPGNGNPPICGCLALGHIPHCPTGFLLLQAANPRPYPRACDSNPEPMTVMNMRETLTPRERLNKALQSRNPDRVPIDLGGNQTGIHKNAHRSLIPPSGAAGTSCRIMDAVQQLAKPCEALLQRCTWTPVTCQRAPRRVGRAVSSRPAGTGATGTTSPTKFGVRWSMPEDAPYYMDITLQSTGQGHPLLT